MRSGDKLKFRKLHKGRFYGIQSSYSYLYTNSSLLVKKPIFSHIYNYNFISLGNNRVSQFTLESVRKILTRFFKKKGKVLSLLDAAFSKTQKPSEVRMGKGKGSHAYWFYPLYYGTIMFRVILNKKLSSKFLLKLVKLINVRFPVFVKIMFNVL